MEEKFIEKFSNFCENKKHILIPNKAKYDEMVLTIQKGADEKLKGNQKLNLLRRYTLHIEQQTPVLYHQVDSGKENAQRVLCKEELFDVLQKSHEKLGHAGRDVMWNDLRKYYGISKFVFYFNFKNLQKIGK